MRHLHVGFQLGWLLLPRLPGDVAQRVAELAVIIHTALGLPEGHVGLFQELLLPLGVRGQGIYAALPRGQALQDRSLAALGERGLNLRLVFRPSVGDRRLANHAPRGGLNLRNDFRAILSRHQPAQDEGFLLGRERRTASFR